MTKKQIEEEKRRKEWLERRKKGIGASDAPNILGLTTWGSALSVYLDKIGESEDFEMTERMEIGLIIEDTIVKLFKKHTGLPVHRVTKEMWSKEHPFLFATPDGRIPGEKHGLECKNIGMFDKDKWDGRIPDQYMIQCQHSMLVTGYTRWYLAALFSGNRFETYIVERDDELILKYVLPRLQSFWNNVTTRKPPEAQSTDGPLLIAKFPEGLEESPPIKLGDDTQKTLEEYEYAKAKEKEFKAKKDACVNILKQRLGDNKFGWTDNQCVSWSRWDTERIDTARLKKEQPDIFKKYIKTAKSGKLTISDRKEGEKNG